MTTSGNTVIAGQSTTISCTVTLPNLDKYSTDTSVKVMWTRGLSTKSQAVSNTVIDSRSLSAVSTSQAGTYTCTAQVVYTGLSLYVMNSTISDGSDAILRVRSKFFINLYVIL